MKETIFHLNIASIAHYHSCTGTVFLHSLLDDHPEIISIPGVPNLMNLFKKKYSSASEALEKFLNDNPCFFDTALFKPEMPNTAGLWCLGKNKSDHIVTDQKLFEDFFYSHIKNQNINPKTIIISIYYAYAKAHGVDLSRSKCILFHPHEKGNAILFHKFFPESKYIIPVRNPIRTYCSIISNVRRKSKFEGFNYIPSGQLIQNALDLRSFHNIGMKMYIFKFERFGDKSESLMKEVANYLDINFSHSLLKSTFGGYQYWGANPEKLSSIYDKKRHTNLISLKKLDLLILNSINKEFSKMMDYKIMNISPLEKLLVPLIIMFPLEDERKFFLQSLRKILKIQIFLNLIKFCIKYFPNRIKLLYIYFSNKFSAHYEFLKKNTST